MFNFVADKLPEKYESTSCCDVWVDVPNKSFHVFNPVSFDVLYAYDACQFGPDNKFVVCITLSDTILILSIYGFFSSATIQHLKLISNSAGNCSFNLTYMYSSITTLLTNCIVWFLLKFNKYDINFEFLLVDVCFTVSIKLVISCKNLGLLESIARNLISVRSGDISSIHIVCCS